MANDGYLHYQLSEYKNRGEMVSLFVDDENPDDFIAGYVLGLNYRQVVIRSVSPVGRYDGLMGVSLGIVGAAIGEDEYALRLSRLLRLRAEEPGLPFACEPEEDLFHALLRLARDSGRVVTCWSGDSEITGFVAGVDDLRVRLDALDFFGQNPQPVTLVLRDIDMISLDAEDERMYELLNASSPAADVDASSDTARTQPE
ncbi:MAG: hypothetical protein IJJ23_07890 [Clostridia bacterium]|nr:hypothetical protein [Clostridia bacterium]